MVPFVKILDGARGAVSAAGGAARHVAWFVSHHMRGSAR
jgi:hypothetical protein